MINNKIKTKECQNRSRLNLIIMFLTELLYFLIFYMSLTLHSNRVNKTLPVMSPVLTGYTTANTQNITSVKTAEINSPPSRCKSESLNPQCTA